MNRAWPSEMNGAARQLNKRRGVIMVCRSSSHADTTRGLKLLAWARRHGASWTWHVANDILKRASKRGDLATALFAIEEGADDFHTGVVWATRLDRPDMYCGLRDEMRCRPPFNIEPYRIATHGYCAWFAMTLGNVTIFNLAFEELNLALGGKHEGDGSGPLSLLFNAIAGRNDTFIEIIFKTAPLVNVPAMCDLIRIYVRDSGARLLKLIEIRSQAALKGQI